MPYCEVLLVRVFRRKKIQMYVVLVVEGTLNEKLGSAFHDLYDPEQACESLYATFVIHKVGEVNLAF